MDTINPHFSEKSDSQKSNPYLSLSGINLILSGSDIIPPITRPEPHIKNIYEIQQNI
jgi:hypothetical protein